MKLFKVKRDLSFYHFSGGIKQAKDIIDANQNANQNQNGFTLIEVIIVVAFFSVSMLTIFTFYQEYGKTYQIEEAQVDTTSQTRAAVNDLIFYTTQARRVLASQTINGTLYSSGPTTLVLQLPSINSDGDILNTWDYAVYFLDGAKLSRYLQTDASSARNKGLKVLSDSVSILAFNYDNADFSLVKKVGLDLETHKQVKQQSIRNRVNKQLTLRNY